MQHVFRSVLRTLPAIAIVSFSSAAQAGVLWAETFDAAAPGQAVSAAPLNWTAVQGTIVVGASPHPGWQGNAIVAAASTNAPQNYEGAWAQLALPVLPTVGIVTLSYDAWAPTTEYGAQVELSLEGDARALSISNWANCCMRNVWYVYAHSAFTGSSVIDSLSPPDFMRNTTVHVSVSVDYDQHLFSASFDDGLSPYTTPSFAFAGNPRIAGLSVWIDKRGGSLGGDFDNFRITAVPQPETYAMLLAGLALVGIAARRRERATAAV